MKRRYTEPTLKAFDIRAEEKIAGNCGGGEHYWNGQLSGNPPPEWLGSCIDPRNPLQANSN
ncbi:MAG: hypothetical protein GXY05_15955 [Clostridiales bacterium]|nr:hypothetical protein [Clostridiales bacterium]